METNVINLPVRPHLKKVILHQFNNQTPIKAELNTVLGKQLQFLLLSKTKFSPISERYTETIEIELPQDVTLRSITLARLTKVNHYYDDFFKDLMMNFVEAQRLAGVPAFQALKNFLKFYKIHESEYSLEAAHRSWTRYNSEYKKKKKEKTSLAA